MGEEGRGRVEDDKREEVVGGGNLFVEINVTTRKYRPLVDW